MPQRKKGRRALPRLGKLPPQYRLFLNPYSDARFTSCPQCGAKTRSRKLPLVIHVDPMQIVTINKTCRYCPNDDLLIAHQNELEGLLAAYFEQSQPEIVGNDYLVLGTMDRPVWRQGMQAPPATGDIRELLHDFRDYVRFEPAPRWGLA